MTNRPTPETEQALEKLWLHVVDRWDDDAAHVAFLQNSQETGTLAHAASRYRELAQDPARTERVQRQLAAIMALAFASLEANKTRVVRPRVPSRQRALMVAFLVGATPLLVYLLLASFVE